MRRIFFSLATGAIALMLLGATSPGGGEEVHRPIYSAPQNPPIPRGLRGLQTVRAAKPPPAKTRPAPRIPLAQARGSSPIARAGVAALTDAHACRIACARPYYFCLAGQEPAACPGAWSQCVTACDGPLLPVGAIGQ